MRSTCFPVVSPNRLCTGDAACHGGEERGIVSRSRSPGTDPTPLLEKKPEHVPDLLTVARPDQP